MARSEMLAPTPVASPVAAACALTEARLWIGTPYHHQAALRGCGADCVGLVRGVYAALYGPAKTGRLAYSRDWGDASGNEGVLAAAQRFLVPVHLSAIAPGHVAVFRWRARGLAKHCGIIAGGTFIHALERRGVVEASLDDATRARVVAVFGWPAP